MPGRPGCILIVLALGIAVRAEDPQAAEFFEKKVRPILANNCLECHGADAAKIKGKFRLTSRAEMLKGGESGPEVVPGDPDKSRLIAAIRYKNDDLKMPPKGKLANADIALLESWVKNGAIWPTVEKAKVDPPKPGQIFTDEQKRY